MRPGSNSAFHFFGGKGGVGKTTCAAARALAEAASGAAVLVVSTDPAHSLGDVLGVKLSARPTSLRLPHRRTGRLYAVELDAPRAFERWIREHRAALGDILEHGTWLDRPDVDAMINLPVPGIDELMGLIEISRLASAGRYDSIVIDTAPTGHTLRLIAAQESVSAAADVLDALQEEHRYIRQQFARVGGADAADRLIALIADQAAEIAATLHRTKQTAFHWVTSPEALSIAESEDAIAALTKSGIRIAEIIVNQVIPPSATRCAVCDQRRSDQRKALGAIGKTIGRARTVRIVPADLHEPRGVPALARLGRCLGAGGDVWLPGKRLAGKHPAAAGTRPSPVLSVSRSKHSASPESLSAFSGARLLLIGGKGGVGKTTVAAAVAMRLARATPQREVLLLSTDPAHSLSDVFGASIGDRPSHVQGTPENLSVREVDARRSLRKKRAALEAALNEMAFTSGMGEVGMGEVSIAGGTDRLMSLAPPGIDELFGMLSVIESISTERVIVVDMAPTGHALRLLESPAAARAWIQTLLRLLLKYRSLVRPGRLAEELLDASQSIRELQALLRDRKLARFILVTRAAAIARAETERLLERLRQLKLSVPALVVNARTLAPGACTRCRATADAERRELVGLARASGHRRDCAIIQTPLVAPPPQGVTALDCWARSWIESRMN